MESWRLVVRDVLVESLVSPCSAPHNRVEHLVHCAVRQLVVVR